MMVNKMMVNNMSEVTRLLQSIEVGDERAADKLLPLVYEELRRLARARLSHENGVETLRPTELVHEAYLRLVGGDATDWNGSSHFFGAAAKAMRRIVIDRARRRQTTKHGGGLQRIALEEEEIADSVQDDEKLLRLDTALQKLEAFDSTRAQLVQLRYFAGLTNREAAQAMGISTSTADRYWVFAKAWLQKEM